MPMFDGDQSFQKGTRSRFRRSGQPVVLSSHRPKSPLPEISIALLSCSVNRQHAVEFAACSKRTLADFKDFRLCNSRLAVIWQHCPQLRQSFQVSHPQTESCPQECDSMRIVHKIATLPEPSRGRDSKTIPARALASVGEGRNAVCLQRAFLKANDVGIIPSSFSKKFVEVFLNRIDIVGHDLEPNRFWARV